MINSIIKRLTSLFCVCAVFLSQANDTSEINITAQEAAHRLMFTVVVDETSSSETFEDNKNNIEEENNEIDDEDQRCEILEQLELDTSTITLNDIIDELAQARESIPQLSTYMTPYVRYYQDRMDEAQILDSIENNTEFRNAYVAFKMGCLFGSTAQSMVLLTPTITPKTYAFVGSIAKKMGLPVTPYIYLLDQKRVLNAAVLAYTQSTAILILGEFLIQTLPDTKALEFLIAHELAHAQQSLATKKSLLQAAFIAADVAYEIYRYKNSASFFEYVKNSLYPKNIAHIVGRTAIYSLITAWQSRMYEKDADLQAVQVAGAEAGIIFMQKVKELQEAYNITPYYAQEITPENDSFKAQVTTWLKKTLQFVLYTLRTHPSDDERIAYLTELLKQQETEKTVARPA